MYFFAKKYFLIIRWIRARMEISTRMILRKWKRNCKSHIYLLLVAMSTHNNDFEQKNKKRSIQIQTGFNTDNPTQNTLLVMGVWEGST